MVEAPPVISEPAPYRDRGGWLIFFGIVQILFGLACLLFALFMLVLPRLMDADTVGLLSPWFAVAIYSSLAVVLIWLGTGSILARRWARALSLLLAWSWLVGGIFGLVAVIAAMPMILSQAAAAPNIPPEQRAAAGTAAMIAIVAMVAFFAVFFVALPAVMAWFYSRRDVKATCEDKNPLPCWTDACPLLVLFLSLWQAFGSATMLLVTLLQRSAFPAFGFLLVGWEAKLLCLAMAAIMGWCAWMLYRLRAAGWWATLVFMFLFTTSGIINSLRIDQETMYRAMGYSETTIAQIQQSAISPGMMQALGALTGFVPVLVILLVVRRHFRPMRATRL